MSESEKEETNPKSPKTEDEEKTEHLKAEVKLKGTVDGILELLEDGLKFTTKSGKSFDIPWQFIIGALIPENKENQFIFRCIYYKSLMRGLVKKPPGSRKGKFCVQDFLMSVSPEAEITPKKWISAIMNKLASLGQPPGVKIKVILNPVSGGRKAGLKFPTLVTVFESAGCILDVFKTSHAGHAKEEAATMDVSEIDRIICVSGDGMFNEVLNGVMSRDDWKEVVKRPFGIVPFGTGNGLSAATRNWKDKYAAVLTIIKGRWRPFDLCSVFQQDPLSQRWSLVRYGLLALCWALISDVEVEASTIASSVKVLPIKTAVAIPGIIRLTTGIRRYEADLYYLPVSKWVKPKPGEVINAQPALKSKKKHRKGGTWDGGSKRIKSDKNVHAKTPGTLFETDEENGENEGKEENPEGAEKPEGSEKMEMEKKEDNGNKIEEKKEVDQMSPKEIIDKIINPEEKDEATKTDNPEIIKNPPIDKNSLEDKVSPRKKKLKSPRKVHKVDLTDLPEHKKHKNTKIPHSERIIRHSHHDDLRAATVPSFEVRIGSESPDMVLKSDGRHERKTKRSHEASEGETNPEIRLIKSKSNDAHHERKNFSPREDKHKKKEGEDSTEALNSPPKILKTKKVEYHSPTSTKKHKKRENSDENKIRISPLVSTTKRKGDPEEGGGNSPVVSMRLKKKTARTTSEDNENSKNIKVKKIPDDNFSKAGGPKSVKSSKAVMETDKTRTIKQKSPKSARKGRAKLQKSPSEDSTNLMAKKTLTSPSKHLFEFGKHKRTEEVDIENKRRSASHPEKKENSEETTRPRSKSQDNSRGPLAHNTDNSYHEFEGLAPGLDSYLNDQPENLPPGWVERSSKFSYFLASNVDWIAVDFCAAADAHMSDGCIHLVWSESNSKLKFLQIADEMSRGQGSYVDHSFVTYEKVKAFMVRPHSLEKVGHVSVDGEHLPYYPFAMQVHSAPIKFLYREY